MVNSSNARDRAHHFLGQQAPQLLETLAAQVAQLDQPQFTAALLASLTTAQTFAQGASQVGLEAVPAIAQRLAQILQALHQQQVSIDQPLHKLLAAAQECLQLPLSEYLIFGEFDPLESTQRAEPILLQLEARLGLAAPAAPAPRDENADFLAELLGTSDPVSTPLDSSPAGETPAPAIAALFEQFDQLSDQADALFADPPAVTATTEASLNFAGLDDQQLTALFDSTPTPAEDTLEDLMATVQDMGTSPPPAPPLTPLNLFGSTESPSPEPEDNPAPASETVIEDILGALFPDQMVMSEAPPPSVPSTTAEMLFGEETPDERNASLWTTPRDRLDIPTPASLFDDATIAPPLPLNNAATPTLESLGADRPDHPIDPASPPAGSRRPRADASETITLEEISDTFADLEPLPSLADLLTDFSLDADSGDQLKTPLPSDGQTTTQATTTDGARPNRPDAFERDLEPLDDPLLEPASHRSWETLLDLETETETPDADGDLIAAAIAAISRPGAPPAAAPTVSPSTAPVAAPPAVVTAAVAPAPPIEPEPAPAPDREPAIAAISLAPTAPPPSPAPAELPWQDLTTYSIDPADYIRLEVMGQQVEQLTRQQTLLHDQLQTLQAQQADLATTLHQNPPAPPQLQTIATQLGAIAQTWQQQLETQQQALLTLRQNVVDLQTHSLEVFLGQFAPLAHRLATAQGKAVQLTIQAAPMQVDRTVLDSLHAPLLQLISCSLTHSLEPMEWRRRRGKSEIGTIVIRAHLVGSTLVLTCQDDGWGLDWETIRDEAIAQEWITTAAAQTLELPDLIRQWQPTTSRQSSADLTRQSVVLAMVQSCLQAVQGDFTATTQAGTGSTYTLTLPYPVVLTEVVCCQVGDRTLALPAAAIEEVILASAAQMRQHGDASQVPYGTDWVPCYAVGPGLEPPVRPSLDRDRDRPYPYLILLLPSGPIALGVDALLAQEEVVIKSQDRQARDRHGLATLPSGVTVPVWDAIALATACRIAAQRAPVAGGRT